MAKVYNYVVITTALVLFLDLVGFPTGASGLLDVAGLGTSSAKVSTGSFYNQILGASGILIFGIGAAIVAGLVFRTSGENYIILPLIGGSLAIFISSFISIMNYSFGIHPLWVSSAILMIFGPISVGYLVALVEFFRGSD